MPKPPYLPDYLALTRALRAARLEAGLDQEALANKLGVSQTFVSNYERGEKTLNIIEFVAICTVLALEPSELIGTIKPRRAIRRQT